MSPRVLAPLAAALAALAPSAALACGGFFASEIEVDPDQKIVVAHRDGVETYVFRPHFCGKAKDFGVILPIPATLQSAPALADNALFDELEKYTEPVVQEVCEPSGPALGCGAADGAGAQNDRGGFDAGVNVVDRGRVGIFEYVLLQATSTAAFTDWLDTNGFPHDDAGSGAYAWYVSKAWYFVAFKVAADTVVPMDGSKLCGDLGPIRLAFAAAQPVVPSRIAAVNARQGVVPRWRLFLLADGEQQLRSGSAYSPATYFSGLLRAADLGAYPALAAVHREGERLTVLDVRFPYDGASGDIELETAPYAADFRSTKVVYVECDGGCSVGDAFGAFALAGLLAGLRRRRG